MKAKLQRILVAVLLLTVSVTSPLAMLSGLSPPPAAAQGIISLDLLQRIHPYLQYGAVVEPARRVRVIVQKTSPLISSQLIAGLVGAPVLEEFPFIRSLVLEVSLQQVGLLAAHPGVRYITYDSPVRVDGIGAGALRTTYPGAIDVPALWNGGLTNGGLTGDGVTVAVLDSGVDSEHPDLQGDVSARSVADGGATGDDHGHGTHVAGIITGHDARGRYIGVAPKAHVISVRIADEHGVGSESSLLRGLQWVYDRRIADEIRVVNLSVSVAMPAPATISPVSAAVERLWQGGVVVVASAGNRGDDLDAAWYAPANNPFIITAGAVDHSGTVAPDDDRLAWFSSRGRAQEGRIKPDIVAPGRKIVAPLAGGTTVLATGLPERIADDRYIRLSGTSMAAPIVSGIVALILERYPDLTPDQVKWLLIETARAYPGQPDGAGAVAPLAALQAAAGGPILEANGGVPASQSALLPLPLTQWNEAYWSQLYWDQLYWDQLYWDQLYWDMNPPD